MKPIQVYDQKGELVTPDPKALRELSRKRGYQGVLLHPSHLYEEGFKGILIQLRALGVRAVAVELSGKAHMMRKAILKAWEVVKPLPLMVSLSDEELEAATQDLRCEKPEVFFRATQLVQGADVILVLVHGHEINIALVKPYTIPLKAVRDALLAGAWAAAEAAARRAGLGEANAGPAPKAFPALEKFAAEYAERAAWFEWEKEEIKEEILQMGYTSEVRPLWGFVPVAAPVIWEDRLEEEGYAVGLGDAIGAVAAAYLFEALSKEVVR